ncbi:MAG: IS110 family transposase [Gordonibacter pamelaeae]
MRALTLKRDRLDGAIAKRAGQNDISATVKALESPARDIHGHGFLLVAEIGDFSRFPDAKSFMSFLGLVPSESSTGGHVSRGKITRTGNKHARTLLVEAAWHHARTLKPLSRASLEGAPRRPCGHSGRGGARQHEAARKMDPFEVEGQKRRGGQRRHRQGACRICLVDRQDGPGGKLETIGGAHARHRGAWGTLESSMLQPSGHARS